MMSYSKLEAICSEMINYGLKRSKKRACIEFTYIYYQSVKGIVVTSLAVFCHWDLPKGVVHCVTHASYSSKSHHALLRTKRQQRTLNYSRSLPMLCLPGLHSSGICSNALTTCCSSCRCFCYIFLLTWPRSQLPIMIHWLEVSNGLVKCCVNL